MTLGQTLKCGVIAASTATLMNALGLVSPGIALVIGLVILFAGVTLGTIEPGLKEMVAGVEERHRLASRPHVTPRVQFYGWATSQMDAALKQFPELSRSADLPAVLSCLRKMNRDTLRARLDQAWENYQFHTAQASPAPLSMIRDCSRAAILGLWRNLYLHQTQLVVDFFVSLITLSEAPDDSPLHGVQLQKIGREIDVVDPEKLPSQTQRVFQMHVLFYELDGVAEEPHEPVNHLVFGLLLEPLLLVTEGLSGMLLRMREIKTKHRKPASAACAVPPGGSGLRHRALGTTDSTDNMPKRAPATGTPCLQEDEGGESLVWTPAKGSIGVRGDVCHDGVLCPQSGSPLPRGLPTLVD